MVRQSIIEEFTRISRYPLRRYLDKYASFISNNVSDIYDFYSGSVSVPNRSSFTLLSELLKESGEIIEVFEQKRNFFKTSEFWDLLDFMSDIKCSLETIENSPKWIRSVLKKNQFSPNVEITHHLKQQQTLENLSLSLGDSDKENGWVNIALRNNIAEEDYTPDGGNEIQAGYLRRLSIKIEAVVDTIFGKNVYGKDIDRVITFENDDIKVLSPEDTVKQAVFILANLRQGDSPEFPQDGIQGSLIIGTNRNSIAYPVLMRQFYATFKKDDTLKGLKIMGVRTLSDRMEIEFEIETRLNEIETVTSLL